MKHSIEENNIAPKILGWPTVLSLVLGTVIGGGILALPSALAQYGKFGFWAWPLASLTVLNLASMFSHLSKKHPQASGLPSYVKHYYGDLMGFLMSWSIAIGLSMGLAVIGIGFAGYFCSMMGLGQGMHFPVAMIALWGVLALQTVSSVISDASLVIITAFKVLALILISVFGIMYINPDVISATPVVEGGIMGLLGATSLALFAFIGFENGTLVGGNVKNAEKTIPFCITFGTVLASILFVLTYVVVWSVIPTPQLIASTAPVAEAAGVVMGPFGFKLMALLAVVGCIGSLNGCLFCVAHILCNGSKANILPKSLSKISRAGFPVIGGIVAALLTTCAMLIYFTADSSIAPIIRRNIAQLEVFLALIVYLCSCLVYKLAKGNIIRCLIGVGTCFLFLAGAIEDRLSAVVGILSFLAGIVVYSLFKKE